MPPEQDPLLASLSKIQKRFTDLERTLEDPKLLLDRKRYEEVAKERSELLPIVTKFERLKVVNEERRAAEDLRQDPDMTEMVAAELRTLDKEEEKLRAELEEALLPKDPWDDKDILLEVRAGTGGEEAALFGRELMRMYTRFAESLGYKVEMMDSNATGMGGIKEVVLSIHGKGAYSKFKYESGTHRVQRVPATEASGRIHTSAATVAVMPEAAEVDFQIDPKDLRVDTFRASGKGGQHVNKTDSAVRITHVPTGFAVACQDERSQHQNRAKAMRLLRSRLLEQMIEKQHAQRAEMRKVQVGTGDRSEKIRTYNFPQDRLTDHRINFSVHNLPKILDGEIGPLVEALMSAERIKKMEARK